MEYPTKRDDGSTSLDGARLVVVEDDFLIMMELQAVLEDAGAEIVGSARTVAEALDLVPHANLNAAILDVRLGSENIGPVVRLLEEYGVPYFFYTGQGDSDPILEEWPGRRILAKPARPTAIVSAVEEMVKR